MRVKLIKTISDLKQRESVAQMFNGYKSKAECLRAIRKAGFNFTSAFGKPESNPKVAKNMKLDVLTIPHNLSPAKESGFEVCAQRSVGCTIACLHTAGNPVYLPAKLNARIQRTLAFFKCREAYLALMAYELQAHLIKANKVGMKAAARLNTTSDIEWSAMRLNCGRNLFELFPSIQYYDYTKIIKRAIKWASNKLPPNYHITFSKNESNDNHVKQALLVGCNVAICFDELPESYMGIDVFNGDLSDYRPSDPLGVVIGLRAKGLARSDTSGFTVRTKESAYA